MNQLMYREWNITLHFGNQYKGA